jgi:hypothetical protein
MNITINENKNNKIINDINYICKYSNCDTVIYSKNAYCHLIKDSNSNHPEKNSKEKILIFQCDIGEINTLPFKYIKIFGKKNKNLEIKCFHCKNILGECIIRDKKIYYGYLFKENIFLVNVSTNKQGNDFDLIFDNIIAKNEAFKEINENIEKNIEMINNIKECKFKEIQNKLDFLEEKLKNMENISD